VLKLLFIALSQETLRTATVYVFTALSWYRFTSSSKQLEPLRY
jgi:hypothetical protein